MSTTSPVPALPQARNTRPTGSTISLGGYKHVSASGFCAVCGSVWPCAQAPGDQPTHVEHAYIERRHTV